MPENEYITLKEGYKIYSRRQGEGSVKLLAIHGGPGLTHECFDNFYPNLAEEDIQLVVYDQLGSFYSDQPDDPSLWNIPRFVDELHQVVQAHEVQNHFVFASSWGAILLIEYVLKYDTPFKGIILSGMPASFQKFRQNIHLLRKKLPDEVLAQLETHEKEGTTSSPAYQQLVFEQWFSRHYCILKPWPESLMNMLGHLAYPVMISLFGGDIFNFNGPAASWDRSTDLEKIETPTLLIAGKEDLMFEEDLDFMLSRIPRAEKFISPTGGHFCWWADEKEFFNRLLSFMRKYR